ncbi:MAG: ROK family transcriptional regulator [Bacteroidetes bacterium]|nr:ROK family transcriptional regulator [Bacteroidota bacterium]
MITIRENSEISRLEIARLTGLSTATVTRVVDSLMNDDDLVEERGNISLPKGRPRKPLYFKGHDKYIIGIDLGTTSIRGVLSDLNLESIKEVEIVTEADEGYEHVLSRVVEVVHSLQNTSLIDPSRILGVGLAVAGLINTSTETVEYSPAFEWNDLKLKEILQKEIALPVFYDNVSRLMALGELQFGKGRNYHNFVTINAGYGIGAGIIFNKKLFYGTDGMAGEFGHVPVFGDNMITCSCGKTNCLSAYSSGVAIARRAMIKLEEGQKSILSDLSGGEMDRISAEMVAKAYEQGDLLAQEIFNEGMDHLGSAIAGLINVLNPEAIFVGGGLSLNGPVFWDNLVRVVNENILDKRSTICVIEPVTFPGKAAIIGAVGLVLNQVLNFRIDSSRIDVPDEG